VWTWYDRSYTQASDKSWQAIDDENLQIAWKKLNNINNQEFLSNLWLNQKDLSAGNIYIEIDMQEQMRVVREIALEYACAEGKSNRCDNNIVSIRDLATNLKDNTSKDLKESKNIILQATNRLAGIFQGKNGEYDKAYQQRKQQLVWGRQESWLRDSLGNIYDDSAKIMRGNAESVVWLWSKSKNAWKTLSDTLKKPDPNESEVAWSKPKPASKTTIRESEWQAITPWAKDDFLEKIAVDKENQPKIFDKSITSWQASNSEIAQRQALERSIQTDRNRMSERGKVVSTNLTFLETNVNRNVVETSVRWWKIDQLVWSPEKKKSASYAATAICKLQCPELWDKKCWDW